MGHQRAWALVPALLLNSLSDLRQVTSFCDSSFLIFNLGGLEVRQMPWFPIFAKPNDQFSALHFFTYSTADTAPSFSKHVLLLALETPFVLLLIHHRPLSWLALPACLQCWSPLLLHSLTDLIESDASQTQISAHNCPELQTHTVNCL